MAIASDVIVVDSRLEPAARCLVCGNDVPTGEGMTAVYAGMRLRFRCPGCLTRFQADPDRYLAGHPEGCCRDEECASPISEWSV